jgi:hypothetical protein
MKAGVLRVSVPPSVAFKIRGQQIDQSGVRASLGPSYRASAEDVCDAIRWGFVLT